MAWQPVRSALGPGEDQHNGIHRASINHPIIPDLSTASTSDYNQLFSWDGSRSWRERPMSSEGSISRCIVMLKAGDQAAAQRLWEAYAHRLINLARTRLRDCPGARRRRRRRA